MTGLEWLAGIDDALEITRESLRGLADDRRTLTVTRKHLEDALDDLSAAASASLGSAGKSGVHAESGRGAERSFGRAATPASLVGRSAELALHADTLVDIARTFSAERGDEASAEVLACAVAVKASLQSHQRDFDQLMPWAKLLAAEAAIAAPANAADRFFPEQAIARIFDVGPDLGRSAQSLRSRDSSFWRSADADLAAQDGIAGDSLRIRVDDLVDALKRSASAALSLQERLEALGELSQENVRRDGVRVSLQPGAPTPRDRLSGHRGQPRFQLL